jgi:hypothetical protein
MRKKLKRQERQNAQPARQTTEYRRGSLFPAKTQSRKEKTFPWRVAPFERFDGACGTEEASFFATLRLCGKQISLPTTPTPAGKTMHLGVLGVSISLGREQ